jgi:ParB family chromosome partitioning protein
VLVRPVEPRDGLPMYEIIAGERRTRAARLAGLSEVPVLVRDVPDQAVAVMALIENIQREDLNPLEEAQGVQRLITEFGLNREGAAQAIGRSASAVSNMLRLLNLVEPVQQMLTAGDLDMGHARALLSLDRARQITCAHEIVARKLSVRETERLVNRQHEDEAIRTGAASAAGRTPPPKSRDVLRLEEQLADLLAVPVEIRIRKRTKRGDQGELAISFGSLDDLGALLDRLGITER